MITVLPQCGHSLSSQNLISNLPDIRIREECTRGLIVYLDLLLDDLFNIIALPLGWFSFGSLEYWIIHAVMIAVYFLIWLIQYLIYKHKVKELNRELENWKSRKNNDGER